MGVALAEQLLPDAVRNHLFARMLQANSNYAPVRLRLEIAHNDLARLPWEYVYLKTPPPGREKGDFLCRMDRFHLVRQAARAQPVRVEPRDDQLRVLVAWANPRTLEYGYLAHLDAEVKSVLTALSSPACWNVAVRELQRATRGSLEETLREWPPHVLHFTGHGDSLDGGVLCLHQDADGADPLLSGAELARWLSRTPARLVVLSACDSVGVAETLARKEIPTVISMQLPLRDTAAEPLARHFYSKLAQPSSVEEALWWARQGVGPADLPDWGAPVLYLAGNTSNVIPLPPKSTPTNITRIPNRYFTGRDSLLAQIQQAFHLRKELRVALVGMGGVGKTELAVQYALAHLQEYPGGVFWINARNAASVQQSYAQVGREYLNAPPGLSTEEQAAQAQRSLQRNPQPALLIYDDVTEDAERDLPLAMGACHVLVTTREWFVKKTCYTIETPLLEEQAAVDLLLSHQPVQDAEERAAAQALATRLGRLPLALTLITSYVDQCDIRYADYYTDYYANHPQPDYPHSIRLDLLDIIDRSHRRLTPQALAILALAAHFAGHGIPTELLYEAYCQAYEPMARAEFQEAVGSLVGYSLLAREELQQGERARRLTLHDIIRDFAQERLSPSERETALTSIARVLTTLLKQANEKMDWQLVRKELPHCSTVIPLLCQGDHPLDQESPPLLLEMGIYFLYQEDVQAATEHLEKGLSLVERSQGRRNKAAAQLLSWLGMARQKQADPVNARKEVFEALEIAQEVLGPDDPDIAEYYDSIGTVLTWNGLVPGNEAELQNAATYYEQAIHIGQAAYGRQHTMVAKYLSNLGMNYFEQKQPEIALTYLREALSINQALNGPHHATVAIEHYNIGQALYSLQHWHEAREHYQLAVEIHKRAHGSHPNTHVGASLYRIAQTEQALGQKDAARRYYEEALHMFEACYGSDHPICQIVNAALQALDRPQDSEMHDR